MPSKTTDFQTGFALTFDEIVALLDALKIVRDIDKSMGTNYYSRLPATAEVEAKLQRALLNGRP